MQPKVVSSGLIWRGLAAAVLWGAADWGALLLWLRNPPFIGQTYGRAVQLFELYSFTHVLALAAIAFLLWPCFRARRQGLSALVVFCVVGCLYLTLFEKYARPSYDFTAWANGMWAQLHHGDPYAANSYVKPIYWYPPALAQMLAGFHHAAEHLFPRTIALKGSHRETIFHLVFYAFQCTQFILLAGLYWLTYGWGRRMRLEPKPAALAAGFLVLFNVPLLRLLGFHQLNLWLVNSILAVLLLRDSAPLLAGLALALGFHMKLYPAILGLPLLLAWRWKPLVWAGVFTLLIFAAQCVVSGPEVWPKFLALLADPPIGSFFRDNSLHGIAKNLLKPFHRIEYTGVLWGALQLVAVGGMAWRMARREWRFRTAPPAPGSDLDWRGEFHFQEQAMDTLAMSFFLSPMVFEHHYVMAIPIILWTWIVWGSRSRTLIVLGSLLILIVPIYDVVPLSWNRIAGLLLLIWARPVANRPPPAGVPAFPWDDDLPAPAGGT